MRLCVCLAFSLLPDSFTGAELGVNRYKSGETVSKNFYSFIISNRDFNGFAPSDLSHPSLRATKCVLAYFSQLYPCLLCLSSEDVLLVPGLIS